MKRIIITLLLCMLLQACSTQSQSSKVQSSLAYGTSSNIEYINPVLMEEGHSELTSLVYRGLMKQKADNEVEGDIADSWQVSEDELVYTFSLKEAVWHDGASLTAEDVVFTFKQIVDPSVSSPLYADFQTIKSVEEDNGKVIFTLSEPTPTFLHKLKVGIIPKHLFEDTPLLESTANKQIVGNGPYKLMSWSTDDVLTFERNEDFYGVAPSIEKINVYTKLDENTKLLRLKTGELDVAQITPQQVSTVEAYDGIRVEEIETADYRALQFNTKHPVLQDTNMRRAVNALIDREHLLSTVLKESGELAYGPLQKSWARFDADTYTFDEKLAHRLLSDKGYEKKERYYEKDGEVLAFEVVAPISDPVRVALATVIVEQLQQQGINAQLVTKDWQHIVIEEEDTFLIGWGSEDDPDTHTYRVFHSEQLAPTGYNYARIQNTQMDTHLANAKKGTKEERTEQYTAFQHILAEEMPFSFLVYLDAHYAVDDSLKGITGRTLGHNGFGLFWNVEEWSLKGEGDG